MSEAWQSLSFVAGDLSARLTPNGRQVVIEASCDVRRIAVTMKPVNAVQFADEVARLAAQAAVRRPGWSVAAARRGVVALDFAGAGPEELSPAEARSLSASLSLAAAQADAGL